MRRGDCNRVLLEQVFPSVRYEDYRRALCLLDPYGLDLEWKVIAAAGRMRSIEMFLNFPVMDMNRNALWRAPEQVGQEARARMTAFWGDESWRETAYRFEPTLFGDNQAFKEGNEAVVHAFADRLKAVAGFHHVADPLPMRNSKNAVVYYLIFAAHQPVALHIVKQIFDAYRNREA